MNNMLSIKKLLMKTITGFDENIIETLLYDEFLFTYIDNNNWKFVKHHLHKDLPYYRITIQKYELELLIKGKHYKYNFSNSGEFVNIYNSIIQYLINIFTSLLDITKGETHDK